MTRRGVLAGTAALGATAVGLSTPEAAATPAGRAAAAVPARSGPATVGPDDTRYPSLTRRGTNARFVGKPDYVRVADTTEQVVEAVQQAVREGRRVAVRSGGHCFEGFVDDPSVKALIDLSPMTAVHYDASRRAFAVEPGALLGQVYRRLFTEWGVSIPAGASAEVGVGGHVLGGGYGALSRRHGLSVDHLYGVEVVVVDASGKASSVVATRDSSGPLRELWWAHTGGGGGNFGIVTRYWFRDPAATGSDPTRLLPRPPASVLTFSASWPWKDLDERSFARLVRNHGTWYENNSAPGSPYAGLFSVLMLNTRKVGTLDMIGQLDSTGSGAERLLDDYLAAVGQGTGARPTVTRRALPWLQVNANVSESAPSFFKAKSGYLRKRLTDRQIDVLHEHLTGKAGGELGGSLWLVSYGGKVNTVPADATAVAQRDSILKAVYLTAWEDPRHDGGTELAWLRDLYKAVYADSGGVPAPGTNSDGCFINYPDADLADPAPGGAGTPWHTLYYKGHYARLQRVKAHWDPRNEFRHALSIRPPR